MIARFGVSVSVSLGVLSMVALEDGTGIASSCGVGLGDSSVWTCEESSFSYIFTPIQMMARVMRRIQMGLQKPLMFFSLAVSFEVSEGVSGLPRIDSRDSESTMTAGMKSASQGSTLAPMDSPYCFRKLRA